ncbi:MAG TPA: hypothetical protein VLR47_03665, partial [Rhodospirillales bacterium]|nr:hypothetical protein [Rhodospirillales bacterium]
MRRAVCGAMVLSETWRTAYAEAVEQALLGEDDVVEGPVVGDHGHDHAVGVDAVGRRRRSAGPRFDQRLGLLRRA